MIPESKVAAVQSFITELQKSHTVTFTNLIGHTGQLYSVWERTRAEREYQ